MKEYQRQVMTRRRHYSTRESSSYLDVMMKKDYGPGVDEMIPFPSMVVANRSDPRLIGKSKRSQSSCIRERAGRLRQPAVRAGYRSRLSMEGRPSYLAEGRSVQAGIGLKQWRSCGSEDARRGCWLDLAVSERVGEAALKSLQLISAEKSSSC